MVRAMPEGRKRKLGKVMNYPPPKKKLLGVSKLAGFYFLLTAIGLTPGGSSTVQYSTVQYSTVQYKKNKVIPLQAWCGPEGG